jgi:hypothetical protein
VNETGLLLDVCLSSSYLTSILHRLLYTQRNGMIGSDYSTKFAPWLAHGNVSPRQIARECRRYEEMRVQNKSTVSGMHVYSDVILSCPKIPTQLLFPSRVESVLGSI